jgi:uncharacterized membrane protein YkoI
MNARCIKPYVKNPETKKCTKNKKIIKKVECRKSKISTVMSEFKRKELKSKDRVVTSYKQAIAIALSIAGKKC